MRALLPLLVACGGGSSTPDAAPDVPHGARFALDFTFGTNGEALVTPPAASGSGLALVIGPGGLYVAISGAMNQVCQTNLHGKVNAAFGTGGCTADPGIIGPSSIVATGLGVLTVRDGTVYQIDATGRAGASLAVMPTGSFVLAESDGFVVADATGKVAHASGNTVDATAQVATAGDQIRGLVAGPTLVGTRAGLALALRIDDTLALDESYGGALAGTQAISQAYVDGDGIVITGPGGVARLNPSGALDTAFGNPITTQPTAVGVLTNELVAVAAGTTLSIVDHARHVSTDLDPLPSANAATSLLAIASTSDGGFIAGGFTANGLSVALVHYVPQ